MAISYSLVAPKNDTIVVDRTRAADPVRYNFKLRIKNQGTSTVYYKLTESSGTWSISSPSGGQLGSVGSGGSKIFDITLQRALPTSDVVETIDLTLEAYSDSGYSNLIESTSFSLTAILADIHSWPSYTKYDFDDGTDQGWSLSGYMSVSSAKSISAGGYSVRVYNNSGGIRTTSMSKTETIPNTTRAVLVFYVNYVSASPLFYISVKVNGVEVYKAGDENSYLYSGDTGVWDVFGVDLSDYAGQSVTLEISLNLDNNGEAYIDDIIFAGTDTL